MLVAGVPALLMCLVFEKFGGLRQPEHAELVGLDAHEWGVTNFDDDLEPSLGAVLPAEPVTPAPRSDSPVGGLPV
jgi:hypothetical protein